MAIVKTTTTQQLDLGFDATKMAELVARKVKELAAAEIRQQQILGNGPHVLTVDGKRRVSLAQAKFKVQADFAAAQLQEAITYVEDAFSRRVPFFTGNLRASYFWVLNKRAVNARALTEMRTSDTLRYTTTTIYGRRAYFRARKKSRREYAAKVARGAKRLFRALTVTEEWFDDGSGAGRQPSIAIRMLKVFANG